MGLLFIVNDMIILEVKLNGDILYRIGGEDLTHSSVIVDLVGNLGSSSKESSTPKAKIEAFGSTQISKDSGEIRKWKVEPVGLNDEIVIRLVEAKMVDAHVDTQSLESGDDEVERKQFEYAKKMYLKLKSKYEI